jgi:hypothetical protein
VSSTVVDFRVTVQAKQFTLGGFGCDSIPAVI